MKTNHCVWLDDSAACIGSELTNLQHVAVHIEAFIGQALTCSSTNKRKKKREKKPGAVKATIKGNRSGFPFQSHPVMVLISLFKIGKIWFSQTPSGHILRVLMALFHG